MPKLQKVHDVTVRIRFDKKVSAAAAKRAAREHLHGTEIFASFIDLDRDGWGEGVVRVRAAR